MVKGTYITFILLGNKPNRKTNIWQVDGLGSIILGYIRWFPSWRKYTFAPSPNTVFEETCLREIADFCATMTKERKEQRKLEKEQVNV